MGTLVRPASASALPRDAARAGVPGQGLEITVRTWRDCLDPASQARWSQLAERAIEPNPFFEPWYLLPSLQTLDPAGAVRVLVIEQHGDWLGLLPVIPAARYYGRPLPHWTTWLHANAFLGLPLIARGHVADAWQAILHHLDAGAGRGLFLHLPGLPVEGPAVRALRDICGAQRRRAALVHREERAMLAAGLSPEAYLEAALGGKKRKELRRQFARLSDQGAVTTTRQRDDTGIAGWIAAFLALELAGWKGAAGSALACNPANQALFAEALTRAAALGRLERLTLALDGRPIAMLATFLAGGGAFSYKTTFDEGFARYSPGVLLQRENLALLDDPALSWCDSCAAPDHPMIDHLWRERRVIGRLSLALGGPLRRGLFGLLARAEGAVDWPEDATA